MDASFVQALATEVREPLVVEIGTRKVLLRPDHWKVDRPLRAACAEALKLGSLTGLRDYLQSNVDGHVLAALMVVVQDPRQVVLYGKLAGDEFDSLRESYIVVEPRATTFPFGRWLDAEEFFIALQTQFQSTPKREELLNLIASIRESNVREVVDDGAAQQVTTAAGVALKSNTRVPNPVTLRPYRTFLEVEQPESLFVLRMHSSSDDVKPKIALFEADGGAWRDELVASIRAWLARELPGMVIIA
jgi:hypothetical protein